VPRTIDRFARGRKHRRESEVWILTLPWCHRQENSIISRLRIPIPFSSSISRTNPQAHRVASRASDSWKASSRHDPQADCQGPCRSVVTPKLISPSETNHQLTIVCDETLLVGAFTTGLTPACTRVLSKCTVSCKTLEAGLTHLDEEYNGTGCLVGLIPAKVGKDRPFPPAVTKTTGQNNFPVDGHCCATHGIDIH